MSVATTATPARPLVRKMSPALVTLVLSLCLGVQPITTDLYLPALPALTESLGAPVKDAQLTLTVLLLAFGFSQLLWGPLSDRFGRRPVLLWGLALYTLGGVMCALAPSMGWLLAWRGVQGASMGAVVMSARALQRDLFTPQEGARVMAKALGGLGLIAVICPPLGGLAATWLDWRAALAQLAVYGAALGVLIALRFEETLPPERRSPLQLAHVLRNAAHILTHPRFLTWCALVTASYASLFVLLAASPFVFARVYGLSSTQIGLCLSSTAGVYVLGTLWCRHLLHRMGPRRALRIAGALSLLGGTSLGLLALAGVQSLWAILGPMYIFMLAHGIHQPCAQSGVVASFPHSAGTASALCGVIMMSVAFILGQWLGWRLDGTALPLTNGIWFWSVVIALLSWTVVQRHGDTAEH